MHTACALHRHVRCMYVYQAGTEAQVFENVCLAATASPSPLSYLFPYGLCTKATVNHFFRQFMMVKDPSSHPPTWCHHTRPTKLTPNPNPNLHPHPHPRPNQVPQHLRPKKGAAAHLRPRHGGRRADARGRQRVPRRDAIWRRLQARPPAHARRQSGALSKQTANVPARQR